MNYNQNQKLAQITPKTLIVGIDIAKDRHVARAQDDRGFEFGKRLFFDNRIHGFEQLLDWISRLQKEHEKSDVIIGAEPTGQYWLSLAYYLKTKEIKFVLVNPMHTKRLKELDDNSPTKNDTKDARVVAQLVKDGRYSIPNLLEGVYAELREAIKVRDQLIKQQVIVKNRIQHHIQRYFPEFDDVFKDWTGKTALFTLRHFPFPSDILELSPEEILAQWRTSIKGSVGINRAKQLIEKAKKSIGVETGLRFARQEILFLLDQYELYSTQLTGLEEDIEELLMDIPGAKEMIAIPGVGPITIATFFAEVGDLSRFTHPQQIVNLAGLSLREHSSGKFKGQTRISKRGRKRLRKVLYAAMVPLVANNPTFKALHHYYTTRLHNPLKGKQSLIALCTKLIRALFVIGKKQCEFDGNKLLQGIPAIETLQVA